MINVQYNVCTIPVPPITRPEKYSILLTLECIYPHKVISILTRVLVEVVYVLKLM